MKIHCSVVDGLSDPLRAMINNGQMKKSISRVAELEDVDVEIFGGFCKFAYTGCYTPPTLPEPMQRAAVVTQSTNSSPRGDSRTTTVNGSSNITGPELRLKHSDGVRSVRIPPSPSNGTKRKSDCLDSQNTTPNDSSVAKQLCDRFPGLLSSLDYHETARFSERPDFLFHAKLYVFATRYLIESLRGMTVTSLHRDLLISGSSVRTVYKIHELLEFTYENTSKNEGAT